MAPFTWSLILCFYLKYGTAFYLPTHGFPSLSIYIKIYGTSPTDRYISVSGRMIIYGLDILNLVNIILVTNLLRYLLEFIVLILNSVQLIVQFIIGIEKLLKISVLLAQYST